MPVELIKDPLFFYLWETIDYSCPIPMDWERIRQLLEAEYLNSVSKNADIKLEYGLNKMPTPLILGGWWPSTDAEKKERWVGMLVWAYRNGFAHIIENNSFQKYGCKTWPYDYPTRPYNSIFPNELGFWELLRYLNYNGIDCSPRENAEHNMQFRRILSTFKMDQLIKVLCDVTLEDLAIQDTLVWHDALEIILVDLDAKLIKDSIIYREYTFVFNKYYEIRRKGHLSPPDARKEVIRLLNRKETNYES